MIDDPWDADDANVPKTGDNRTEEERLEDVRANSAHLDCVCSSLPNGRGFCTCGSDNLLMTISTEGYILWVMHDA